MPLDATTDRNENNINFIATLLYGGVAGDVGREFPYRNYRLRLRGLTEFSPYLTESPRSNKETDDEYESRLLLSGRVFGEEEILLDDLVHSESDINNLNINSRFYDGQIPRTILYLDECNKNEIIRSVNLNDSNYVQSLPPDVVFPVDLNSESAGYEIFRKTSSINKAYGTSALIENISGWHNITGYSNSEVDSILDGGGIVGFTDDNYYKDPEGNISYSGYKPFQNELFTSYKIINRSVLDSPPSLKDDLKKDRKVDVKVDPSKSYSLERRVTRDSNDTTSDPSAWEIISADATFPYVDSENLSDFINTNVNFEVTGVYDVIEPTGVYADGTDYFEVDLLDDWGKTDIDLKNQVSNREKTQELTFRSGESIKVVQRATSKDMGVQRDNTQWGSFDLSFNPHSTGISGCVTGSNNEKNFYQLEYQLIPKGFPNKKLHYEKASDGHGLAVGDNVFLNTGQEGGVYPPVRTNIFGEYSDAISTSLHSDQSFSKIQPIQDTVADIGPSYEMGISGVLEPEVVPYSAGSGLGYSYFSSGEKYLVIPKGGYSSHDSQTPMSYDSAGERRDVFFQGEQDAHGIGDGAFEKDAEFALTEYRTYDNVKFSDARFQYGKEREVRVSEKSLCLGDSASDLPDDYLGGIVPSYILDSRREHTTAMQLKNANILNIDSSDGSIKISNLKNNREEFRERCNLFFEKEYTASLTILATGQKQDISPLKQYIEEDKVYYLERDIYIDSDVNSQANTTSPEFKSDSNEASLSPFSTGPFTPNPQSLGQEKLYLTQTYHNDTSFPYNDFEFYNYQPTIKEEFTYSNHSASVIDDGKESFLITNGSVEKVYRPGSFDCFISPFGHKELETEGYSVLMNTGYHDAPQTSESFNVDIGSVASNKVDVYFTPSNKGSYHEIQTRANSSSDWVSVSPAVEAVEEGAVQTVADVYPVSSSSASDYRVLEWFPSSILSKYNGITLPNESPDSLILKSEGSRVYDISKVEHSIDTEGAVALVDDDPFTTSEKVISFPGANTAYLSISPHRSFNIQNGEFSFEFWIKQPSYGGAIDNIIFSRSGAYSLYLSGANKLRFDYVDEHGDTVKVFEKGIENFSSSAWKHVALCKVMAGREKFRLYLYIDGKAQELTPQDPEAPLRYLECAYDDYSGVSNEPLIIGKGLSGKLYQPRFYIGKSLYRGDFTVSETEFTKEANQRKYKILKFIYTRGMEGSNWIINRNQFENVGPPSDYLIDEAAKSDPPREVPEESTYHTYEWLNLNSMPGPLDNKRTRALVNYFNGYAYNAPNNPHINKNYEGKAITKDSQIDEVVADNYFFRTSAGGGDIAAPYLYEFLGNSSIDKIRFNQKGGADTKTIKQLSEAGVSYSNGSRLRVTKYVYRLYTKTAVVVGDIGYKNSRSSQSGWAYQLQYSTDGSAWTDIDHTDASEDNSFFYNDIEGLNSNSYENIDYVTILSRLVLKSNITEKYHPEDIQFRIEKRQIISLGGSSLSADVVKKVNPLPVVVNIPTTGTLLDLTQKSAAGDADSRQGHHYADSDGSVVRVYLDSNTDYVLYKDSQEEILLTENADDPLQIKSISMNTVQHADADGNTLLNQEVLDGASVNTYESLEDGKPYSVGGLTGITISGSHIGSASSNLDKLEAVKSVVGVKPSGLLVNRVEKSFGSIDFGSTIYSDAEETKIFLTPEITGSHLDELEDFAVYTPNDSSTEESLIQFTCRSCITGDGDPIETGVSGVSYTPAYDFFNDPVMKGKFNITAEDDGKTFLCSGSQASGLFIAPPSSLDQYTFDIVNIGGDAIEILRSGEGHNSVLKHSISASEAATVTAFRQPQSSLGASSGVDTILPDIVVPAEADESLIIVEDMDSLSITDSNVSSSCIAVNISSGSSHVHNPSLTHSDGTPAGASLGSLSGVSFNSSAARVNQLDSGVLVVEHDKIVLTPDDAYMTGVIDTSSTLVLPKGLNNGEHVTLLNATDDEVKTVSELNYKIDSKSVDYIPKETARKFTYSSSSSSWSSSDVDVVKYNQLDVDSGDDNKVFIHNEDVDVRVTDGSLSTGFNFNVVRSQINQIDFNDLRSQSYETPLLRVFVNGYLKYTAPPGVLGVKVVKQSYGWEFKKIEVLRQGEIIVDPDAHGKIFQFQPKAYGDELTFHFVKSDSYPSNFEFFVCSLKVVPDLNITFESEDNEYKFNEQEEEGSYTDFKGAFTSKKSFFRVSRKTSISGEESGDFTSRRFFVSMVGAEEKEASNVRELTQPNDTKGRVIINRNENFSLELPNLDGDFNIENGLDLTFVNASETNSEIDGAEAKAFSAYNCKYKDESYEKQEKNLHGTDPKLSHNDFVVLDGSLSNVALREFYEEDESVADHKYSEQHGIMRPKDHLISFSGSSTTSTFKLPKHELVSNQKITFNGGRITYADYYYEKPNWDPFSFNGAITSSVDIKPTETLLVYDSASSSQYTLYEYNGVDDLTEIEFTIPEDLVGNFSWYSSFNFGVGDQTEDSDTAPGPIRKGQMFIYIKKGSGNGTGAIANVNADSVHDLFIDSLGSTSLKDNDDAIPFTFSFDESGDLREQTFFVKVINQNEFYLYEDRDLSTDQVTFADADDFTLLSTEFNVHSVNHRKLSIVNLGDNSENVKSYFDETTIVSSLESERSVDLFSQEGAVYSQGDVTPSGVHILSGLNDMTAYDTLNINGLQASGNHIVTSGVFHAHGDLNDNSFNDKYYINAGLDKLEIANTTPNPDTRYTIKKNRIAKHTNNDTYQVQDQSTANRDAIYYPKDEIHIPNRVNLGKTKKDKSFDYNFVFYDPVSHNEDLVIVLPNSWSGGLGKVAVVNAHNRAISVVNFSRTISSTVNANSVLFMEDATNYSSSESCCF